MASHSEITGRLRLPSRDREGVGAFFQSRIHVFKGVTKEY